MDPFSEMGDPIGAVQTRHANVVVSVGRHDQVLWTWFTGQGASAKLQIEIDLDPGDARELARLLNDAASIATEGRP